LHSKKNIKIGQTSVLLDVNVKVLVEMFFGTYWGT
jgi:hypothetical protein